MTAAADRKGFDPLLLVMAFGFVVVVAALAYPAFRADPMSAPGMVLIFTVGAVALIGLFAFGRGETKKPTGDATVDLLDAMAEPAALVWASGEVLAFNAAWADAAGATPPCPRAARPKPSTWPSPRPAPVSRAGPLSPSARASMKC